jgi:hypothetical protein
MVKKLVFCVFILSCRYLLQELGEKNGTCQAVATSCAATTASSTRAASDNTAACVGRHDNGQYKDTAASTTSPAATVACGWGETIAALGGHGAGIGEGACQNTNDSTTATAASTRICAVSCSLNRLIRRLLAKLRWRIR